MTEIPTRVLGMNDLFQMPQLTQGDMFGPKQALENNIEYGHKIVSALDANFPTEVILMNYDVAVGTASLRAAVAEHNANVRTKALMKGLDAEGRAAAVTEKAEKLQHDLDNAAKVLENVGPTAEIAGNTQQVMDMLKRMQEQMQQDQRAINLRLAAIEAKSGGCCVIQ